jgi:hypothetical protein
MVTSLASGASSSRRSSPFTRGGGSRNFNVKYLQVNKVYCKYAVYEYVAYEYAVHVYAA